MLQQKRCLLDSAATHEFIIEDAVTKLGTASEEIEVTVTGIDQRTTTLCFARLKIQ